MRYSGMAVGAVLAAGTVAQAGYINEWNLIVRNDLFTTSETDASALIGGSLMGTSNFATHFVSASNGDGLAVGGNIGAGINAQINNGGNLRIAGSVLGTANLNGGGSQINDPGVSSMITGAFNEANALSAYFAGLTANGTVDGGGNMNAVPANIGGDLVAVYTLNQTQVNSLGQLNLNFGAADTVIINFVPGPGGVADLIAPPNIIGGFSQANSSNILWNFPGTTSLLVNNSFNGAVLAPDADLQLTGGGINGSVIVDSVSVMNAEIRQNLYTGHIPAPGGAAAALLGIGLASARRRRIPAA